jgi:hypothetical protein
MLLTQSTYIIDNGNMNLQEQLNRIQEMMGIDYKLIPTDELRRPNGSVGTQGFTPESMVSLLKHISNEENFDLPNFNSFKDLILKLREMPEIIESIYKYVKSDPVLLIKLPDDTYHLKDGNHRANLLNLLNVDKIPAIVK